MRLNRKLACAVGACIVVIIAALAIGERKTHISKAVPEGSINGPGSSDPGANVMTRNPSGWSARGSVSAATRRGTSADLERKGYPKAPKWREVELKKMKAQTVEQTAANLGDISTILGSGAPNANFSAFELSKWAAYLPVNMNVLRLIQAGKDDPARVAGAVEHELAAALADFPDVALKSYEQFKDMALNNHGVSVSVDEGTLPHRYVEPVVEFDRLNFVINASFYTLANIDRLPDPSVMNTWLNMKPGIPDRFYFNPGMNAWILEQYAAAPQNQNIPGYQELRSILEPLGYGRTTIAESQWDQNWSISDPTLTMGRIDTSDIQTINVLQITGKIYSGLYGGFLNDAASQAYNAAVTKFAEINHLQ